MEEINMRAIDVANYIVTYCHEKGINISNLKLQKLLYFVQASFLINNLGPCFRDEIEAWDFGPVVPKVYREYRGFGSGNIPITTLERQQPRHFEVINQVINDLSEYSATDLVRITHEQSPWLDAYQPYQNNVITVDSIKEYFSE